MQPYAFSLQKKSYTGPNRRPTPGAYLAAAAGTVPVGAALAGAAAAAVGAAAALAAPSLGTISPEKQRKSGP